MFNIFKKKKTNSIIAPIDGKVQASESVRTKYFHSKIMGGDGIAIDNNPAESNYLLHVIKNFSHCTNFTRRWNHS